MVLEIETVKKAIEENKNLSYKMTNSGKDIFVKANGAKAGFYLKPRPTYGFLLKARKDEGGWGYIQIKNTKQLEKILNLATATFSDTVKTKPKSKPKSKPKNKKQENIYKKPWGKPVTPKQKDYLARAFGIFDTSWMDKVGASMVIRQLKFARV